MITLGSAIDALESELVATKHYAITVRWQFQNLGTAAQFCCGPPRYIAPPNPRRLSAKGPQGEAREPALLATGEKPEKRARFYAYLSLIL